MKEFMEPIHSELPLAKAFNRIISELNLLRIMSNPRVFTDSTDEMAAFRMQNYFLTILWEKWLHGVFNRLLKWANTISRYFDEQLRYHTVFNDLYHDCVDIVQDTKPDDLLPMITTLEAKSRQGQWHGEGNGPRTSRLYDSPTHGIADQGSRSHCEV